VTAAVVVLVADRVTRNAAFAVIGWSEWIPRNFLLNHGDLCGSEMSFGSPSENDPRVTRKQQSVRRTSDNRLRLSDTSAKIASSSKPEVELSARLGAERGDVVVSLRSPVSKINARSESIKTLGVVGLNPPHGVVLIGDVESGSSAIAPMPDVKPVMVGWSCGRPCQNSS